MSAYISKCTWEGGGVIGFSGPRAVVGFSEEVTKQMGLKGISWAWSSHFTGENRWGGQLSR